MGCVDDVEVAGHLSPPDGEDKNLHRHVDVNDKSLRHRSHRAVEWCEVSALAAHLEVQVIVGRRGIEPTRAGFVGESNTVLALADILVDVRGVVRHRRSEDLRRQPDCEIKRGRALTVGKRAESIDREQSSECCACPWEARAVIGADLWRRFPLTRGEPGRQHVGDVPGGDSSQCHLDVGEPLELVFAQLSESHDLARFGECIRRIVRQRGCDYVAIDREVALVAEETRAVRSNREPDGRVVVDTRWGQRVVSELLTSVDDSLRALDVGEARAD